MLAQAVEEIASFHFGSHQILLDMADQMFPKSTELISCFYPVKGQWKNNEEPLENEEQKLELCQIQSAHIKFLLPMEQVGYNDWLPICNKFHRLMASCDAPQCFAS